MTNKKIYIKLFLITIFSCIITFIVIKCIREIRENYDNSEEYDIKIYEKFLSDEECDYIINKAKPNLVKSEVMGSKKSEKSNVRTSTQLFIKQKNDPTLLNIAERITKLSGRPINNQEDMQVLNYKIGQEYKQHYDACTNNTENCKNDRKRGGLRDTTVLIYLSNVEEGGETFFPKLKKEVKPVKGRAVFFRNLTSNNKKHHPKSLHVAKPIIKGEKWAMNVWTRLGEFN